MKKLTFITIIIISIFIHFGCNKQSIALNYEDLLLVEKVDGYSRDMFLNEDTLFVVSEDDGLLIYNINENSGESSISLSLLYSDSLFFQSQGWNLSGILYSEPLNRIFILDKFYSIQHSELPDLNEGTSFQFEKLCCQTDNQHPSTFTINQLNENLEIFTLVRNKSNQAGVKSDVVSIFKTEMTILIIDENTSMVIPSHDEIIDSLIYDATDIHYRNNSLFISHTSNDESEFKIYKRNDNDNPFGLDTTIRTPFLPDAIYSDENFLFVGMEEHGGAIIYNMDSMEEISWISQGFSVRDIYWDPGSKFLLLSCGYQGVVVFELDNDMNIDNTWVLSTSYAYTARDYNDHVLISTRNGIEIIKIK